MDRIAYEPCIKNAAYHWHREKMQSDRTYAQGFKHQRGYHVRSPGPLKWWSALRRRQFEDWLWEQNARLVRENKEFYLEFMDPQMASLFALRWSGDTSVDN